MTQRKWMLAVALTLFTFQAGAQAPMRDAPADVGAGRVAWFDISTNDLPKSRVFYEKLFDWQFTALQGTDKAVEIVSRGTPIGTLRSAGGALAAHNGVVYLQVEDVVASCQKAKELGATVIPGFPFNLNNRPGAICLLTDPSGHPVGMYSRTAIPPKAK